MIFMISHYEDHCRLLGSLTGSFELFPPFFFRIFSDLWGENIFIISMNSGDVDLLECNHYGLIYLPLSSLCLDEFDK